MKKILVIDDDMRYRDVVLPYLQSYEFEVHEAATVAMGLKFVAANSDYALLIVDGMLPDGNGLNVIKQIRESGNDVPIIFITAMSKDKQTLDGLVTGLNVALVKPKPIVPTELCHEILDVIRKHSQTKRATKMTTENKPASLLLKPTAENSSGSLLRRPANQPPITGNKFGGPSTPSASSASSAPSAPSASSASSAPSQPSEQAPIQNGAEYAFKSVAEQKLETVRRSYLAIVPKMIAQIREKVEFAMRNPETAAVGHADLILQVHNLKGTAGMHGFPELGLLMERIEIYLKAVQNKTDSLSDDSWLSIAEALRKAEREFS